MSRCKASHCFHETKEILPDDDFVKINNCYYHKDCYQVISNIREVIDIFATRINKNVVFAELRRVINTIVFKRNIDSELLLFGVNYYLDHNIPINYPQGLYYVVQNTDVQKKYKQMLAERQTKKYTFVAPVDESQSFTYAPAKNKGFADIFGKQLKT